MAEYVRICPVCGKANKRSSSSCVNCGAKLISVIPVLIQGTDGRRLQYEYGDFGILRKVRIT